VISKLLQKFPEGYDPNPSQVKLLKNIDDAFDNGHKFVICNAPTGSGKSFVSKTLGNASDSSSKEFRDIVTSYLAYKRSSNGYSYAEDCDNERAFGTTALTITKALQDQYKELFDDVEVLKGKSNYQCAIDDRYPVDIAPCLHAPSLKRQCWAECKCPYYEQRNKTLVSKFNTLNYNMFFALPDHLKKRQFLICDEASELEDQIVKQYSVFIDPDRLKLLGVSVPSLYSEKQDAIYKWICSCILEVSEYINTLTNKSNNKNIQLSNSENIKLSYLKNLHRSLNLITETWEECEYVVQRDGKTARVMPLKVDVLSKYIFKYADNVLLMSATIIDHKHFAKSLGIKEYEYVESDSTFDPEKAPIYINTKQKINHYNLKKTLPKIVKQIEEICNQHEFEKGIIHTHTGFIASYLQNNLKSRRFLYRDKETRNEEILRQHSKSKNPTVLVSPSLGLGIDLKDDLARFQIIIKAPYLPLGDKRIKKLFELDKQWYSNKMLSNVVQQCGRGIRSKQDHCKTYILDAGVYEAIIRNKNKLPKYFIERFV